MTPELKAALDKLVAMKHPSLEKVLVGHGYRYEGTVVSEVVRQWERYRAGCAVCDLPADHPDHHGQNIDHEFKPR